MKFAYHTHATEDSDKCYYYARFVCHDKAFSNALFAQAHPIMMKHLIVSILTKSCNIQYTNVVAGTLKWEATVDSRHNMVKQMDI